MIGTKLNDRYEIVSELGRGGMGVVYKAHDPLLSREVAIKLIAPALLHPEADQRFRSEAQAVAKMDHPAIVPIYDLGEQQGSIFFVMPVLAGQSLRHHLRDQSMTLGDILDGIIQVAEALEYSHSQGVLHRDIKPENLMVTREGGKLRFRLMDFGLARDTNTSRLTKTGVLVGTMGYMSPEQVKGEPADGRSDLYSLGTVLYECLTGDLPFSGEMQSILYRIVHEIPQGPRAMGIDVDEELERIVLGLLAKKPEDRPQSASDLVRMLHRYRDRHRESDRMMSVMVTQALHAPRPAVSPFVGREKEMAELQMRLNSAKAGECQLVLVSGDAGIGKTRLLDELEALARAQSIRVLHGRFMEQDGAFPYHGFCELIQDHFRQRETGSSGHSDLSDLGGDLVALFPMLSEIQDIRSVAATSSAAAAVEARQPGNKNQIFELLARTLTRLAGGKPMVLVLEDLHGAEISIEVLQYIVRRLGPTPTLILGTYRPGELGRRAPLVRMQESLQGDPRYASLSLGPLAPAEHKQLLSTLLGGKKIDAELAQQLYSGSEGNPFFAKELVRSLLDSESLIEDTTGTWKLSGLSIAADELPETIQAAVEKRVAGLPAEMIQVLCIAAVMGKSFDFDDLETLAGKVEDLDEIADRLVQEGLIEEERRSRGDVMAFTSGVVREVLYSKLTRRKRRSLHRSYAELLEKRHAGRLERVYPQLLYHYAEGDEPEKTVEYGLLHSRKSLDAFSPEEAIRAARAALDFLDEEWEGDRELEAEARMLLARAHHLRGETTDGLREAEAAIAVLEHVGDSARVVATLLETARMAWQARRAEETMIWVERGLAAARAADDQEGLVELLSLAATLANLRAEYGKANTFLQEAERLKTGTQPAARGEEIPAGGTLVAPFVNTVSGIDPAEIGYDDQVEIAANVFETLLATDGEGRLNPLLCESWEAVDEGRTFVFTLRKGVRFHDGSPLTAGEVKRSFEETIRLRGAEMRASMSVIRGVRDFVAGQATEVAGITAAGVDRLEFHLENPLPIYPALLTEINTAVAKRGPEDETGRTLGTGPFRLASRSADRIRLEANPEYWNGPPRLAAIEFRPGVTAGAIADGLRSGDFDLGRSLPAGELEDLLRDPRFRGRMAEIPGKQTFFVLLNATSGPMARTPELRRALCRVVPVRDLVWRSRGRFAEPATGIIPPGLLGHDPGRRRASMTRDEARQLLAAAGLDEGIQLRVAISPGSMDRYGSLLKSLFGSWSEIGVEAEVVTPTMEIYNEKGANPEGIDVFILGWISDYDDPDALTHELFNSQTGRYRKVFSSPEADAILLEARAESRPDVRVGLYRKFENLLEEEGVLLPLFHETNYRIPGPRVRALVLKNSPPYVNYRELGKAETEVQARGAAATGGGTIRVPQLTMITRTLDPRLTTHVDQAEIVACVFETLTRVTEGARVVPWLASQINVDDGGKRYRFRLRDGVRFHDGRRLTTRDVRFTFERVLTTPECEFRQLLAPIRGAGAVLEGKTKELEGFEIHSSSEFSIHLDATVPFFPSILSHLGLAIVPEGIDFEARSYRDGCAGTGAFRVMRFQPGERIEMERNPNYWRDGYPKSDGIVFEAVPTSEEIYSGFRRGHFSLASSLSPAHFQELRRHPDFAGGFRDIPSLSIAILAFNTRRGPLQDPVLRRRLSAAIDRDRIARSMSGTLAPAKGLIPPGLLGHNPGSSPSIPMPDAAEAGGGSPQTLTLVLSPTLRNSFGPAFEELEATIREAGFTLEIVPVADRDAVRRVQLEATSDLLVTAWVADYPDTHAIVHGILDSREGQVGRFCGSPELDRHIGRAQVETDPAVRHGLYRQIEETVAGECLLVPLFYIQIHRFARPEVNGLTLSFAPPDVIYENLRIRT